MIMSNIKEDCIIMSIMMMMMVVLMLMLMMMMMLMKNQVGCFLSSADSHQSKALSQQLTESNMTKPTFTQPIIMNKN